MRCRHGWRHEGSDVDHRLGHGSAVMIEHDAVKAPSEVPLAGGSSSKRLGAGAGKIGADDGNVRPCRHLDRPRLATSSKSTEATLSATQLNRKRKKDRGVCRRKDGQAKSKT